MDQSSKKKKKRVVTTVNPKKTEGSKKIRPTKSRVSGKRIRSKKEPAEFIFKKQNFILMGIGVGLVAFGFLLMSGGQMPDPNTWDESIIYSFRRITLAPIIIVAGLIVEIVAIFKKV